MVSFSASSDFATSTSRTESNRNATTFAKDVTERSVSRILQRVREERTRRSLEEFEEIKDELRTAQVAQAYVQAWTEDTCHGCWLHYPGFCIDGEGWDEDYRMVARINVMERDQVRIRTECVQYDESIDVIEICCEAMGEEESENADVG